MNGKRKVGGEMQSLILVQKDARIRKLETENKKLKEEVNKLKKEEFVDNIATALKQIKNGKGLTKEQVFGRSA